MFVEQPTKRNNDKKEKEAQIKDLKKATATTLWSQDLEQCELEYKSLLSDYTKQIATSQSTVAPKKKRGKKIVLA